jgi:superfamily II DNA or RNA helicase
MDLLPYQSQGLDQLAEAIRAGHRRIVLTSPTGGGKTVMMGEILKRALAKGNRGIVYVNKRMLTTQTTDALSAMGIDHGIRAAGHGTDPSCLIQVASMQTEHARLKAGKWDMHDADIVLVDEAHVQQGKTAAAIFAQHVQMGAVVVGVTATPLDMGELYDHLIVAGTNSELRACGRLVPATHYGCDEPDFKALKLKDKEGADLTENENRKAIMTPTIFARVLEWHKRLNPEMKPAMLFGPGVQESLWFAERFVDAGIPAAHIDGADIWMNGEFLSSSRASRGILEDASRTGKVKVICNRYVLREGVNWPWIEHLILAFVAGSLQTYLQIGGRGLRASPETGKTGLIVQDHGGAWWRHGSLNADRVWNLNYTNSIVSAMRGDRMRAKVEKEPWRCPGCGQVLSRSVCPCGWEKPKKQSRPVVQANGELREMEGDIFKPRRIYTKPNGEELWEKMYFRSRTKKGERTFRAAMILFARENYFQWPDPTWRFMPKREIDKYRLVSEVPREHLT